jgi:hypothetical protein
MTDHLTNAILAAARLDDTAAVAHIAEHLGASGYDARKLMREFPVTLPALLADRPSLRAAVERAASPDEETDPSPSKASHAIALAIRAQSETDPSPSLASLEAMGYPHLADLARRARAQIAASRSARVVAGSFEFTPSPWHPYATREEWEAACDAMARALGGPL